MNYREKLNFWLNSEIVDSKTKLELESLKDEKEIEDRFYKDLEFGTGGLRGVVSAGTNRMNIYTVGKVTQGLSCYINENFSGEKSVVIAHDSRIMSEEFSKTAAEVFAANGIKVFFFESLRPTPMLSYAVRYLKCNAGVVVTASHNPKQYNGYKVYGDDGGQVTDAAASNILRYIEKINDFSKVYTMDFNSAVNSRLIEVIGEKVDSTYYENVKDLAIRKSMIKDNAKSLNIIYTPIHGSGNIPVRRVLNEMGYENVTVVKEQEMPDGNFPTAPYPNPEDPAVFEIAMKMAEDTKPDIIFGTDPDCDRIGVVVKDNRGKYRVLTGNQTGALLANYMIKALKEENKLPINGVLIKTIVTTDIVKAMAEKNGVSLIEVLTGFKYIGEKIKEFQLSGEHSFILGFEESYGYLSGSFVRDKDAVIASSLICEMALYYKLRKMNLFDALTELYDEYGYYNEKLVSIELKGKDGQEKISNALENLRHSMRTTIGNVKIAKKLDYKLSIEKDLIGISETTIELPKSNVLKFILEDGSWFVVRPSGTEPKIKIYLSVIGNSFKDSEEKMNEFKQNVMDIFNEACKC